MKTVTPWEIEVGGRYVVTQHFADGHTETTTGICTHYEDEYLTIHGIDEPLNIHPHVGMPQVYISEF